MALRRAGGRRGPLPQGGRARREEPAGRRRKRRAIPGRRRRPLLRRGRRVGRGARGPKRRGSPAQGDRHRSRGPHLHVGLDGKSEGRHDGAPEYRFRVDLDHDVPREPRKRRRPRRAPSFVRLRALPGHHGGAVRRHDRSREIVPVPVRRHQSHQERAGDGLSDRADDLGDPAPDGGARKGNIRAPALYLEHRGRAPREPYHRPHEGVSRSADLFDVRPHRMQAGLLSPAGRAGPQADLGRPGHAERAGISRRREAIA